MSASVRFARHLDSGGGRTDGDPLVRASIDSGPSEPGDDDVQVCHRTVAAHRSTSIPAAWVGLCADPGCESRMCRRPSLCNVRA